MVIQIQCVISYKIIKTAFLYNEIKLLLIFSMIGTYKNKNKKILQILDYRKLCRNVIS